MCPAWVFARLALLVCCHVVKRCAVNLGCFLLVISNIAWQCLHICSTQVLFVFFAGHLDAPTHVAVRPEPACLYVRLCSPCLKRLRVFLRLTALNPQQDITYIAVSV